MNLSEETTLTKYAQPLYKRFKDVNWPIVRELILKYRQQKQAVFLDSKRNNQPKPKYYTTCGHPIPSFTIKQRGNEAAFVSTCGHLISSFTIKQGKGFSIRCAVPRASRWVPVTLMALLDEETEWHYNNPVLRPFARADYRGGQLTQFWGRDKMEKEWRQQAEPLAYLAKQLNDVAEHLRSNKDLAILLQPKAPRLGQLSSSVGKALGYVAYFFDCWQHFHEYKQAAPATTALADAGAVSGKLGLRQVALLYVYESKVIPKAADEIARHYGYQSGAKLYAHYLTVSQRAGRTGDEIKGQKLPSLIKDIVGVIPHLSNAAKQQAESELQTLKVRK